MKKIIITICLLAFVVVSAFPVFAAPGSIGIFVDDEYFSFMSFGNMTFADLLTANGDMGVFAIDSNTGMVTHNGNNLYFSPSGKPVYADSGFIEYEDYHLVTNVSSFCDGSTCPATDANRDNVCDDCGMTFAVLRDYDTWPDPYSVWTEEKQSTFPYCIMYEDVDGNKVLVMSSTRPYYDMDMIIVPDADSGTTYARYSIFGSDWRLANSYTDGTEIISGLTYPSFNIFNGDDTLLVIPQATDFFPIPLWMIPSQVTQGEALQASVVETGTILVLCGVGLMACLMVLLLFSKRSLIFRR